MRRFEALQRVMETITDELVICNIGHPSQELYATCDRPENFYMLGSMGLASSIGLGLALSTEKKVVVLEGDGSVIMNLGTLGTLADARARNLILVIIDNEGHGSTGFQRTFTANSLSLDRVARGCGLEHVSLITEEDRIAASMREALASGDGPHVIVIKTDQGTADGISVIPMHSIEIRDRFMRSVTQ